MTEDAAAADTTTEPEAPSEEPQAPVLAPIEPQPRNLTELARPFGWGFLATLGGLTAWVAGGAIKTLSAILVYIGVALFLSLALDPIVRWLERHKMKRGWAIAVVFVAFGVLFGGLLAIVLPTAINQVVVFAQSVPGYLFEIQNSEWFGKILNSMGTEQPVAQLLDQLRNFISNPDNLMGIGGGLLAIGQGIVGGLTGGLLVLILTLYFLATLRPMGRGLIRFAPAYARTRVGIIADEIAHSVGSYVMGMLLLATANAVFSFIVLAILKVPFALLLAVLALFITMIPMIGTGLFCVIGTSVAMLNNFWAGLIFLALYLVYMQIEAYLMTPRVMGKQVSIPGSLVVIGAFAGATLLGLLGALVAVPVTAAILMILNQVFFPKQDAKTIAPKGSTLA